MGDKDAWAAKLTAIAENHKKRYPDVEYDVDAEIVRYAEFGMYCPPPSHHHHLR